jgi:Arc/MetJ-type ribon-helix-helix transcriptional regulator
MDVVRMKDRRRHERDGEDHHQPGACGSGADRFAGAEGFYSNRTDFIRTAIRNQLTTHAEAVRQTVARRTLVLGLENYTRRDLEAVRESGERLEIKVLGLATIADDVSPELALETIDSIVVLGALRASPAVKSALKDRIQSP